MTRAISSESDLFDLPIIPGLRTSSGFLDECEEATLIMRIDSQPLQPFRFQQWMGKRLTHSFGWNYDFQTGAIDRADPFPDWLIPIRNRAAGYAGIGSADLVQALLIRYDPGAGIGWHRDRPIYEHIVGISLGAAADMRFRRKVGDRWQRATAPLEPRGIYHLSGDVRYNWEHSIIEMTSVRHSITFRSFSN